MDRVIGLTWHSLAPQFPSLRRNRSLLADLYTLLLHGLLEDEKKVNMYRQLSRVLLSLICSVLIETGMSFSIFSSNSYRKKWKYYLTKRLSLVSTGFIKLRNHNTDHILLVFISQFNYCNSLFRYDDKLSRKHFKKNILQAQKKLMRMKIKNIYKIKSWYGHKTVDTKDNLFVIDFHFLR